MFLLGSPYHAAQSRRRKSTKPERRQREADDTTRVSSGIGSRSASSTTNTSSSDKPRSCLSPNSQARTGPSCKIPFTAGYRQPTHLNSKRDTAPATLWSRWSATSIHWIHPRRKYSATATQQCIILGTCGNWKWALSCEVPISGFIIDSNGHWESYSDWPGGCFQLKVRNEFKSHETLATTLEIFSSALYFVLQRYLRWATNW